jgi:hypothetical protein
VSGSSSGSYVTLDALEPEGGSIAEWSATDPSSARMTPLDPSAPEQGLDGEPLAHDVLVLGVRAHDVAGAVLDRGFCTPAVVRTLRELHVDFVAMMPHDAVGYKEALACHGDEPGWGTERLVSDDGTFGATVEGRIWGRHDDRAHINPYFSGRY